MNLKNIFTNYWNYLPLYTACKIGLFDAISENCNTALLISKKLELHKDSLEIFINALIQLNAIKIENEIIKLTDIGSQLTEKHPKSLKYACLNWGAEHLSAWQDLDYSIKTGKSSFEKKYGMSFFDYLNNHPEKLNAYHKAMNEYARDDYKTLPELIDFSKYHSIMDVGGSYGAVLEIIKVKNPDVRCVLYDLESVVANIQSANILKVGGDFFEQIPQMSDAIILSRILHDWSDDKAMLILNNCYEALPKNGTLFVIENCADLITIDLSLLSLNMTVMCESFERTSSQYIALSERSGFLFESSIQLNELQTILIFSK